VIAQPAACGPTSPDDHSRGTVFEDRNGMGMVFVSNQEIGDVFDPNSGAATQTTDQISGTLYFRDGSRAIIQNGNTMQKIDRHGNAISFCYLPCTVDGSGNKNSGNTHDIGIITDALGRDYVFAYHVSDTSFDTNGGFYDTITYRANGSGTANHVIRVKYRNTSL